MRYASVCDGIGAAHVAWQPLGWQCQWTSEIEPFPVAVVEHHYGFRNLGDMTKITEEMIDGSPVDLLVGGTPCQSFSVAGLRGGLADPRGNLALRFVQLAAVMQPRWVVWENVPGVLSSGKGRDFGTFIGALGELGYGFAYRVLDAQWFGVAQRRRRVFVVGYLGDWRRAAAVLFERESVFGNPPTRGATGQGTSFRSESRTNKRCDQPYFIDRASFNQGQNAQYEAQIKDDGLALSLVARGPGAVAFAEEPQSFYSNDSYCDNIPPPNVTPPMKVCSVAAVAFKPSHYTRGKDGAPSEVAAPLSADADKGDQDTVVAAIGFDGFQSGNPKATHQATTEGTGPLVRSRPHCVATPMAVRRLTPRECERLQGFPDDYTLVTYRGKPACDGPRYRALGNSMAVPVMRWIGERIRMVDT